MPIFEYKCSTCSKRFSALVGVLANAKLPSCPQCGGSDLVKQVSRFARLRSEDETMESLSDESVFGDIENDPKAMKKWVREMGKAMDEDLEEDFEAALEEETAAGGPDGQGTKDDTVY